MMSDSPDRRSTLRRPSVPARPSTTGTEPGTRRRSTVAAIALTVLSAFAALVWSSASSDLRVEAAAPAATGTGNPAPAPASGSAPVASGRPAPATSPAAVKTPPPPDAAVLTGPVRFGVEVLAVLTKAGCNQGLCHGNLNGKGGFKLSLRGEDPAFDVRTLGREHGGRRVSTHDPDASLVLRKAVGTLPHEGGVRFEDGSWEYATLRAWIAGGARPDGPGIPGVVRLTASPAKSVLPPSQRSLRITAVAEFSDGTVRDVSRVACYDSINMAIRVSPDGRVTAERAGEGTVLVRYLDQMTTVRLVFLADRPDFAWRGAPARNAIDRLVDGKLRSLRINPSPVCDDATFLRRVSLDLLGRLPTPDEAREFLAGRDADTSSERTIKRRAALVDALLERPEYADFWALKWADLLRADPLMLDPQGAAKFVRWLKSAVVEDRPLDRFAADLLTASGSTYHDPAAAYYRIHRTPEDIAENTAQLFLGVRLKCARCHNHPTERWTQEDFYGLAAFFAKVGRKNHTPQQAQNDVSAVIGEEVIHTRGTGEVLHPKTERPLAPRVPGDPARGIAPRTFAPDLPDPRAELAGWLARPGNPFFARSLANRIWGHLMGRGLVDPVDDFRDSNPAAMPEVLDALADELVRGGFRTRPLVRFICASRVYQTASAPTSDNADDDLNWSRPPVRQLTAEQLLDAVCDVTGMPESFPDLPAGTRAVQLPGGRTAHPFLKAFGKPGRTTVCECERTADATLLQSLQVISGPVVSAKLSAPDNRIGAMIRADASDGMIIDELFLTALTRLPTKDELNQLRRYLSAAPSRRAALEDVMWALCNSKEFLLRH